MVAASEFCISNNVEISFLHSLSEYGLLEVRVIEENVFIKRECLPDLEKMVRLHYDMDINLEGIETIFHLLKKINDIQDEMRMLRHRLRMYEPLDEEH